MSEAAEPPTGDTPLPDNRLRKPDPLNPESTGGLVHGVPRPVGETAIEGSMFAGPVPSPDDMERYEQICPGAAERLFRASEEEAKHRRTQEIRMLELDHDVTLAQLRERQRGQWLGFLMAITALVAATVIAVVVQTVAAMGTASVIGGASLGTLIYAYVHGRKLDEKALERDEQSDRGTRDQEHR